LQKLHDLARQKETLAGSLLLCIIGIAGSGCRGTVRRLVGGGFSTAGPPGEAITQPVAIDPPPKILAPLPISSPRKRKILIHPLSFPHYPPMNQSARPQRDKSIFQISLPPGSVLHPHADARGTTDSSQQ